jgi:heat shock protein 4
LSQDWLYEEGEDTTKAIYVSKMEEIRFIAGPIIQRYMDKIEAERQAALQAQQEAVAKKRAEQEAKRKAEEDAKKPAEAAKPEGADAEMKDAPAAEGEAADKE